ncbi:MAG: hypothetical protein IH969_09380 [Candidatus Krumholzibacteriota bacterium]|nr:hypothetical protein [Candidatus Krumholzibacteriota bacterium]
MKFALSVLVLGIVTYTVYSLKGTPDADVSLDADRSSVHEMLRTAEIYPREAFANNSMVIRMENATRDDYGYLTVKWFRNGSEVEGVSGATLESDYIFKGDQIHAIVNVLGTDALDKPVKTHPATVLNSPPRVITASTALRTNGSDVLGTRIDATDPDGDVLNYSYKWYRNGSEIQGESGPTLDIGSFAKDDEFYAEIVVTDGEDYTAPYRCAPITLSSNAPQITSSPPSSFTADRHYVYQIHVEGPDPEYLSYELVKSPEGMTLSQTGLLDWPLPKAQLGSRAFEVVVRVIDVTGGEVTQSFTVGLSGSN